MRSGATSSPTVSSSILRLYLDDCASDRRIRRALVEAGHQISLPREFGLSGADDDLHFACAREHGLTLLTLNPHDFRELHQRNPDHAGILVVYQDNDVTKDMTALDIARAIDNILAAGVSIQGQVHILNHWRY